MKSIYLIFSATILLTSCLKEDKISYTKTCNLDFPDSSFIHPKRNLYQSVIDEYTLKGLPGISLAIRDDSGLWLGVSGMADINQRIAFSPCHISKSASITKMLVGTLCFLLIQDGLIQLDDPISKYLDPKIIKGIKNANESTIRACLGHTTGIADLIKDQQFYLAVLNNPDKFWEEKDLLDFVRGDDPVFQYGDSVKYSNTNTLLVGLVIEAVTGQSHADLIFSRILKPNNMSHTYYYWHQNPPNHQVAQGYFDLYNNGTLVNLTNYNTGSGNGYGGLYSNTLDLLNFVELLFKDKKILNSSSLNDMLSFGPPEYNKNRLLGLGAMKSFIERQPDQFAYGHSGRDLGYSADAFYFPNQDMTLSFMVNYGTDAESMLQPVFFEFRTAIVDAMMK